MVGSRLYSYITDDVFGYYANLVNGTRVTRNLVFLEDQVSGCDSVACASVFLLQVFHRAWLHIVIHSHRPGISGYFA